MINLNFKLKYTRIYFSLLLSLSLCVGNLYSQSVLTPRQIFEKVSPSVLSVYTFKNSRIFSQASGVIIKEKEWLVTSYSVFAGCDKLILKQGNLILSNYNIIGIDVEKDLMILAVDAGLFNNLEYSSSLSLSVGQSVFAISCPFGLENIFTDGIVSGLRLFENQESKNLIQFTATVSKGSEGGALLNDKGELIGIISQAMTAEGNRNLAVPLGEIFKIPIIKPGEKMELEWFNTFYNAKNTFLSGKEDKALDLLKKVLQIKPDFPEANYYTSRIWYNRGEMDSAMLYCNNALKINSGYSSAFNLIALIHYAKNNIEQTLRDANEALLIDSLYANAYNTLGIAYFKKNEYEKAEKNFIHAIRLNPDYPLVYSNLGVIYEIKGNYEKAETYYLTALLKDSAFAQVYGNLGNISMRKGDYRSAIRLLLKAIDKGRKHPVIFYNLGESYYFLDMYEDAINYFEQAYEMDNQDASTCYFLYLALLPLNKKKEASEWKKKAFQLKPEWKKINEKKILEEIK